MVKTTAVAEKATATVSPVDPDQTLKASKALLAHIKKAKAEQASSEPKKSLLADVAPAEAEVPIWLTLTTKTHIRDSHRLQPGKIAVPHPLNTDPESTICLIVADPQRAYKNMVASDEFPEALRKRITRVIDLSHLKAKFKTYEAQRKLYAEHDIFLADDRIINRLPKALGKTFYKTTAKRPIPVVFMAPREKSHGKRLARPAAAKKEKRDPLENVNARPLAQIVAEIETALRAALVHLSPSTNTAVRVGYAHWPAEHVAENAAAVAAALVDRFVPGRWRNVRTLFLKGPETAALPVWQTDELWLEESKVVADPPRAIAGSGSEKPNIGKKRKSLDGAGGDVSDANKGEKDGDATRPAKKAKKGSDKTKEQQQQQKQQQQQQRQQEAEASKEDETESRPAKAKKGKKLPESNDDRLDKEIAARKAKLKKQKQAAKQAMED